MKQWGMASPIQTKIGSPGWMDGEIHGASLYGSNSGARWIPC
jgi:hypothetical protein